MTTNLCMTGDVSPEGRGSAQGGLRSGVTRRDFLLGSAAVSLTAAAALSTPLPARAAPLGVEGAQYHNFKRVARQAIFTSSPAHGGEYPLIAWREDDPLAPPRWDGGGGARVAAISGVPHASSSLGRAATAHVAAVLEADDPDRLIRPLKRRGGRSDGVFEPAGWDEALAVLGSTLAAARPGATVCLTGPRSPETLWRRWSYTLGTPHHLTLGVAAGRARIWRGIWGVEEPVADLARAGLTLNFGSNFLMHRPEWGGAFLEAHARFGARLISIDPRLSRTAAASQRWVPIRPGTDGLLARALAAQMYWNDAADVAAAAQGGGLDPDTLEGLLDDTDLEEIAARTGIGLATLEELGEEVGRIRPLTVIAGSGVAAHTGGGGAERWIALLALLAGSLEQPGGLAQPRGFELGAIEPLPDPPAGEPLLAEQLPWGAEPLDALVLHEANPAFNQPAADVWRRWLEDPQRVAFSVAIATRRDESTDLCDWILPEAHWLERYEAVAGKGTLIPWVGARQPARTPPGQARPLAQILRDAIRAARPEAALRYWVFDDPVEWLAPQLDSVEGLEEEGGWQAVLPKVGIWPLQGRFDPFRRQVVDEDGVPLQPEWPDPSPAMALGELPEWEAPPEVAKPGKLTLIVHAAEIGEGDVTANHKLIAEQQLANHVQINTSTARNLGIADGDPIRVISERGYLVGVARVTQTVHPEVVTMHIQGGHWSGGAVASGKAGPLARREYGPIACPDADLAHNLWWSDRGVHPMDLIVPRFDGETGLAARCTPVQLAPARADDHYGRVVVTRADAVEGVRG
ncbi:MAG: hypothetical protein COX57_06545 [Alphaproteobacteria bacterium CG_4_10_14_0_2_um_filter_63_37]|nr:MAG: hypothetical protein AUJ55_09180 [Proteobacteria bacterium CG1_02_64_396]PJA24814.1 MAG: hypothetical protein COX57_06545 [Alphaproteobacteria bacterium CG_4_10_14_0_2_um_filter_63_37]